jgi:hypothetical protein
MFFLKEGDKERGGGRKKWGAGGFGSYDKIRAFLFYF